MFISTVCDNSLRPFFTSAQISDRSALSLFSPSSRPKTTPLLLLTKPWQNGRSLPVKTVFRSCFICDIDWAGIKGLKRAFVNAIDPINFIIKCWIYDGDVVPFELKNYWTRERLTLQRLNGVLWLLVRCPIAREEAKWAEWEEEALVLWKYQCNIFINFEHSDIGDGMFMAGRKCLIA
uniref:FBA_2 domain-containing protein n=1 Tax=Globodera pallida TaxID=36090 RepID=A0A183BNC5_GLOPA